MKKRYRIKKSSEIDAIFKEKKVKGDSFFAIYHATDKEAEHFRFALSIGRKYGDAVARNLAKRRIRMIIHEMQDLINKHTLFVVVIKPSVSNLSFDQMREKLQSLLNKSKLMENLNE